jgi:hypothetical protein
VSKKAVTSSFQAPTPRLTGSERFKLVFSTAGNASVVLPLRKNLSSYAKKSLWVARGKIVLAVCMPSIFREK